MPLWEAIMDEESKGSWILYHPHELPRASIKAVEVSSFLINFLYLENCDLCHDKEA
jgi:hypothetical protein